MIQGNYTVKALESVLDYQKNFALPPRDAAAFRSYESLLRKCVPFYLPDNGFVFERDGERYAPTLWQLPYPVTALEYTVSAAPEAGTAAMPTRLVVCYELNSLSGAQVSESAGVDVLLGVVLFTCSNRVWVPVLHVLACPHESLSADQRATLLGSPFTSVSRRGFHIVPLDAVPAAAAWARKQWGQEHYIRSIVDDVNYELEVLAQVLCWLELKNSVVRDVAPSRVLNARRAAKGLLPLLTYKVLDLVASESGTTLAEGSKADRNGPRLHMRRAHRRRHGDGFIGVRACWVGDRQRGAILKDYRVKPGSTA